VCGYRRFAAGNGLASEGCSGLTGLAGKIREGGADFPLLYMVSFTATETECKALPHQKPLLRGW